MDLDAMHKHHHSYGQKLMPGSTLRSQCCLILADLQARFISQCSQGMQCYIHLRRLGRADLTLPEEVGPYLCKWQRSER